MVKTNIAGNQDIIKEVDETAMNLTQDPMRTAYALRILKKLPHPEQYINYFEHGFDSPDVSVQSEALQGAALSGVNDVHLQMLVIEKFRNTTEFRIMLSSFGALSPMALQNVDVLNSVISIIARQNVLGDADKKASLAVIVLNNKPLTSDMKATLKSLLANEKSDEVRFRLTKLLKL